MQQRIESIIEILEECGIMSSVYNVKNIVETISAAVDAELEMESYQHVSSTREFPECAKLRAKLEQTETNCGIFQKQLEKVYDAESVGVLNGEITINHKSYGL